MCAQRRFISACAFAQSDKNFRWAHFGQPWMQSFFIWTMETLIGLRRCAGCFESSFGAHVRRYIFSRWEGRLGWAKMSGILRHWGVQLILAYSWAMPVRGECFYFFCFFFFFSLSFIFLSPLSLSFISSTISSISLLLSLRDDTKWPTKVDVSLNTNTIHSLVEIESVFIVLLSYYFLPRDLITEAEWQNIMSIGCAQTNKEYLLPSISNVEGTRAQQRNNGLIPNDIFKENRSRKKKKKKQKRKKKMTLWNNSLEGTFNPFMPSVP